MHCHRQLLIERWRASPALRQEGEPTNLTKYVINCLSFQVGSSDSPNITSSTTELAHDLAELADLLAPSGFRIAYENWCWATHAPNMEDRMGYCAES
jgi:hypothetical protein